VDIAVPLLPFVLLMVFWIALRRLRKAVEQQHGF